jgi:hypothetical protein
MLLPRDQALRFIEGYKSTLLQVLAAAEVVRTNSVIEDLGVARTRIKVQPQELEEALVVLETSGLLTDEVITRAIRSMKVSRWIYLKHTSQAAILIDEKVQNAFAVKTLTNPIYELADPAPSVFEAGVLEYCGHYVCDGLIMNPVMLGPRISAQLKRDYAEIKKSGRFYTKTTT